jgi:hypothetical protein
MLRRRALIILAVSGSLLAGVTSPAEADADVVQKKSISGPHGRSGKVLRYVDDQGGDVSNYLKIVAEDADGSRRKCTETWIDYATKPHRHFNPGLLVTFRVDAIQWPSGVKLWRPAVPTASARPDEKLTAQQFAEETIRSRYSGATPRSR